MDNIKINNGEVLILKADMMLSYAAIERTREHVISQIKEGVVIIPSGFSYEIWKHDCMATEGE